MRNVLRELRPDAAIAEAGDAATAMQRLREDAGLDLALLDLALPDRSGFDVLADLRREHPAVAVAVLAASNDRDDIARARAAGTVGFIPKSTRREVMLQAFNGSSASAAVCSSRNSRPSWKFSTERRRS